MTIVHDLRFTLRRLRQAPAFTITAVVTLALGLGGATTMESVVRSTLLAPLAYPAQQELVGVGLAEPGSTANADQMGSTYDFVRDNARSFKSIGLADDDIRGANLALGTGTPRTVQTKHVSAGYFPTLGVEPLLGRTFTTDEDRPGGAPVVLMSESLWRTAFHADLNIIGRVVHLDTDPYSVIGVLPSGAAPDSANPDSAQLWQPMALASTDPGYDGDNYQLIARLRPEVSVAAASAELLTLEPQLLKANPHLAGRHVPRIEQAWPLRSVLVAQARSSIVTLSAAVLAVLLVACLNLAGLLSARNARRAPELAVRAALGASRNALVRLLLIESLLLALAGSAGGLLLSRVALRWLLAASPLPVPQLTHAGITLGEAAFVLLLGCTTTVLFGLLPALGSLRLAGAGGLASARTASQSAAERRAGRILIVAQVAVATALLSAGALLLGSFLKMRSVSSGIEPNGLALIQVNLKGKAFDRTTPTAQFIAAAEDRLRQLPGVQDVSAVNGLPLDRGVNNSGAPLYRKDDQHYVETRFISPGYFHAAGTPLLQGADISAADTATSAPVALINRRAATLWWPGRSAIGEYVIEGQRSQPMRVIGVVGDAHDDALAGGIEPTIYIPFTQTPDRVMKAINGWFPTTFLLRGQGTASLEQAAAAAIAQVNPEISVARFAAMQTLIDRSVAAPRFFSWVAGAFAGFALLLTVIGLFGLLMYQVGTRIREFGVRMALGADRAAILRMILGEGLLLTAIGLAAGTVVSLMLRRAIAALLADSLDLTQTDVSHILTSPFAAIGAAAASMTLCATLASLLPARRAAGTNPSEALRSE